jgi:hypothetical protein
LSLALDRHHWEGCDEHGDELGVSGGEYIDQVNVTFSMQAVISGIILLAMLATVFNPFVCHSLL